eukprot:scaffold32639_cov112-Isochrysis_galbana.AAC.2
MPATANVQPMPGERMRLIPLASATGEHSFNCNARKELCSATSAEAHAVSYEIHGPISPRAKDNRPDAIEWLPPVAAYTLAPDGEAARMACQSFAPVPTNTPTSQPDSDER